MAAYLPSEYKHAQNFVNKKKLLGKSLLPSSGPKFLTMKTKKPECFMKEKYYVFDTIPMMKESYNIKINHEL